MNCNARVRADFMFDKTALMNNNESNTYGGNMADEMYFQTLTILEEILQNLVPPLLVLWKGMLKR